MQQEGEVLIYFFAKPPFSSSFFKKTVRAVLKYLKDSRKSIALIFLDPSSMKQLNQFWRHHAKPTTVLSFQEGDIFLCPLEIKKQALQWQLPLKTFYQKLIIHSILHVFGYTHDNLKDAKKMELLESKIFQSLT